jgi:hypothetical protein
MQLSRKDFEKFALVISDNMAHAKKWGFDTDVIGDIASDLSDVLEGSNELFDRVKFLEACGVDL